jgi:hypothetical protein
MIKDMKRGVWIAKFFVFGLLALTLIGFVTMSLWNWLVPLLFSGPVITFWQALGLLLLSKILFWSFGGKSHHPSGAWKGYYMKKRWNSMNAEEREQFKQKMRDKWCNWDKGTSDKESGVSNG